MKETPQELAERLTEYLEDKKQLTPLETIGICELMKQIELDTLIDNTLDEEIEGDDDSDESDTQTETNKGEIDGSKPGTEQA